MYMGQRRNSQRWQSFRQIGQARWLSFLLGLSTTIAVLGVWQQLRVQERLHIQQLVQQEADTVGSDLSRELSRRILSLEQMAHRWRVSGGTPQPLWEADARKYIDQSYGYQAIEWVDPSFRVRWIVPRQGNEAAQDFDMSQEHRRQITLTLAKELRQTLLTRTVALVQGGQGFLACVPLFGHRHNPPTATADRFDGFIVGVFQFETFFNTILNHSPRYQVQIFGRTGLIYSQATQPAPDAEPQTTLVQVYGADWQVQVTPTPILIAEGRSPLPTVVLWGGLVAAWTLAFVVYLGQRFARQAQQSRMINQQLHAEIRHRQQVETQLRESQERLQLALEASAEGWWDWTIATGEVERSPQYLKLLGYEVGEFPDVVDSWKNSIHPDDVAGMMERLNAHLQDGAVPYACEYRVRTKSGEWQWILDYGKVVTRDADHHPIRMIGTFKDIADRKRTELALAESQQRYQNLVDNSPDIIERFDLHLRHLYVSPALTRITGIDANAFLGKTCCELGMDEQMVQTWEAAAARLIRTGQKQVIEFTVPTLAGVCSFEMAIAPELSEQGSVESILCISRDITERQQVEAALRHQKEMFQAIVDHIPIMITLFNADGQIEFINPELERVLGWSIVEWQQRDILVECYPDPTYRHSVLEHMLAATGHWKDLTTYNAQGQRLETTWANVRLSGGRFLGIGQDISDRKRKEVVLRQAMEAAETANVAKSMFLANMSHELRTPLNVILGFAQVMAHDPSLTSSQRDDLQTIRRSGDHLLSLINDVLDLSKIEAGHSTLEETGFDLISLLHGLRTMMTERANAKRLQLIFDIAPVVPQFVIADEQKLRQVLLNLLSNAIKFTKEGSVTLHVTLGDCCDRTIEGRAGSSPRLSSIPIMLQFAVIDTGVGITAPEQETIFDAFVQADAGKKSISGTGLGLTISRKLLELMNGQISVQSAPHVGSTFTITVPARAISSVDVQPEHHDRTVIGLVPGQPHRRVLVVDDQRENRLLMVRLLSQLGLQVREASNGQEAVQIWQDWRPNLIWMDIRMPGLDGYEATKQIRAMDQAQASIIIALTAQASQSDRTLALAAGCNDYISKPFREETIFLKMAEYLGLEYLYAQPDLPTASLSKASRPPEPDLSTRLEPTMLANLSPDWLTTLEDAAVRGDDRAVAVLVTQLAPELAPLGDYLVHLAEEFQFEQILSWLQHETGGDDHGSSE
ncbi:PAS domain S-box protein [Pantanalinema rosaneae CENA516]|uniref:PAS domain S-box protein n=1 Tax=Pantanalinema rosaneae TaxID=1620701 RepID=UPI003D6F3F63